MNKKWLSTGSIAAMAMIVAACGGGSGTNNAPDNTGSNGGNAPTEETQTLILGTSADYAPFEFHANIDGTNTIVGSDIELAKEIAKDLGAELQIIDSEFDGLLMSLNTDKVDMVISGLTATDDRRQNVLLSDIYYQTSQAVLVKADQADQFTSEEDLHGKRIGVQLGSIQEGIAEEIDGAVLTSLGKIPELVMELTSGRVDAIILESPVGEQYARTQSSLAIAPVEIAEEDEGFAVAVKLGEDELMESINATIQRLVESGEYEQFVVEANELLGE
ncbi:transporter substrate-binding domain-containing protein [Paenibacillus sp. 1P07SE]|uniref:transporter substrate-binding domain-containing protein n=1 Tax=Paenibacillus sp. 1P07SE TaxID=3132209 RepID=UPI0039A417A7